MFVCCLKFTSSVAPTDLSAASLVPNTLLSAKLGMLEFKLTTSEYLLDDLTKVTQLGRFKDVGILTQFLVW